MDGQCAFPDQDSGSGEYGNGTACACLQSETRDEDTGKRCADCSNESLSGALYLFAAAASRTCFRNSSDDATRKIASRSIPRRFYTVWARSGPSRNCSIAAIRQSIIAFDIPIFAISITVVYADCMPELPLNESISYFELPCFTIINMRTGGSLE